MSQTENIHPGDLQMVSYLFTLLEYGASESETMPDMYYVILSVMSYHGYDKACTPLKSHLVLW